jgi:hypothetical protein
MPQPAARRSMLTVIPGMMLLSAGPSQAILGIGEDIGATYITETVRSVALHTDCDLLHHTDLRRADMQSCTR